MPNQGSGPQFPGSGACGREAPSAPRTAPAGLQVVSSAGPSLRRSGCSPACVVTLGSPLHSSSLSFLLKRGCSSLRIQKDFAAGKALVPGGMDITITISVGAHLSGPYTPRPEGETEAWRGAGRGTVPPPDWAGRSLDTASPGSSSSALASFLDCAVEEGSRVPPSEAESWTWQGRACANPE